jgi:energy-converting hydrogenase B subunit D
MILDLLLAFALLLICWNALSSPDLFRAVVLFITFGLLVALVWVRLGAPDVAMAEAAVGSGLTGALLLSTLSHMRRAHRRDEAERQERSSRRAESEREKQKEAEVA